MRVFAWISGLGFLMAEQRFMCGWTTACVTSHPPEDIWVVCKSGLLQTKLLHGFLWKCKFSFPWEKCPAVPLLGQMVVEVSIFKETA